MHWHGYIVVVGVPSIAYLCVVEIDGSETGSQDVANLETILVSNITKCDYI